MRIYMRIAVVVAVLLLAFVAAFVLVQREERRTYTELLRNREREVQALIEGVIDLAGRNLAVLAEDYGRWDEMADFVKSRDKSWAEDNVATGLKTFDAQAEWVYSADCELVYACTSQGHEDLAVPPIDVTTACALLHGKGLVHFYVPSGEEAIEIRGATIVPSNDQSRRTPPQGYFFAARVWDSTRVGELGRELGGHTTFAIEPEETEECPPVWTAPDGTVVICEDFIGVDNRAAVHLRARVPSPVLTSLSAGLRRNLATAGALALALLLGLSYALVHWVASPLRRLSAALAGNDVAHIGGLARSTTEIGALARLVEVSMAQREDLEAGIEELREAQEAIQESEERYRTLFDVSSDGLLLVSDVVEDVNSRLCEMTAWPRERLIGSLPSARGLDMPESGAVGAEPAVFEWRASHADGRVMELEVAAVEVTMRGRPMWLASVRDITGRRRAEEERMRIEAELQRTQRLESLTMLAGGVAHDFNNILQAIIGNTDLILEGASGDGPLRARLEAVRSAALRAAALAQQMLAYSGHGRFESAEIGISDLVRETAALVEAGVPKRVRVEYELDPAVPPVRGDRMQLRQAFIGLVTNAAESYAGREGVVRVRTWCEREEAAKVPGMRVEGTVPEGDAVVLEISDTGCGIDAGTLDRIFEPFYTNKATGRGLGLASVVGIARRHAAAVAVRSVVGGGSTFRLVLPVARSQPSEADAGPVPSEAPSAAAASPGRLILIADDERDIREMASAVLEMAGFSVVTAADGLEAVSTFRARQSEFGLVVLDMSMPRMGGDEALREIRALRPDIPAVIASGYSDEDATASVTGLGFTGFLQKPFRTKELTAMARHALGGDAAPGDEQVGQASSN